AVGVEAHLAGGEGALMAERGGEAEAALRAERGVTALVAGGAVVDAVGVALVDARRPPRRARIQRHRPPRAAWVEPARRHGNARVGVRAAVEVARGGVVGPRERPAVVEPGAGLEREAVRGEPRLAGEEAAGDGGEVGDEVTRGAVLVVLVHPAHA